MKVAPTVHVPVMLEEVVQAAKVENGGVCVDGTFGGGGYTRGLLERGAAKVIAIDRDPLAIARGQGLVQAFGERLVLVNARFSEMDLVIKEQKEDDIHAIVLDLGFSSDQLDSDERGFAFRHDGPLDMRMNATVGETAADVLATRSEAELADIFWQYGEEKKSRQFAKAIVARRAHEPFLRTQQLVDLAESIVPKWQVKGKNPAMRMFQALRIYVNDELGELERVLPMAAQLLGVGGRLCVVTFHSLEDNMVKRFFRQIAKPVAKNKYAREGVGVGDKEGGDLIPSAVFEMPSTPSHPSDVFPLSESDAAALEAMRFTLPVRNAIEPSSEEIARNPRARSAQLRLLERVG